VGNRPYNGHNPVKSLNASFDLVRVKDATGHWIDVENGSTVEVKKGGPLEASILVGNTGDATWIAPRLNSPQDAGKVYVAMTPASDIRGRVAIPEDVAFAEDAELKGVRLIEATSGPAKIVLRMEARNRAAFGEIFEFRIEPK